jgi:DNA topoisomerase I
VLVDLADTAQAIVDPKDAAESAGLRHVSDARPGIHRKKAGKGFTYTRADGSKLSEPDVLKRIRALAIPPAWTDVWICPWVDGHIQATGRDAKGRKQYRYHARFREVRESTKYEHVVASADALPSIREKVREHMALRGLPREKVLATVVHLLESTLVRVGNDDYAKHRQERQAVVVARARQAHRKDPQGLPGASRSGAYPVCRRGRKLPGRHIDRRERLSQGNHRQGYHRERLPHLGGDGSRGNGSQ